MATIRYRSKVSADGGAFPVSLRTLLGLGIQAKRVPRSSIRNHVIGRLVFDGGSFPQYLGHSLKWLRLRRRTTLLVKAAESSAQRQTRRWKRLGAVPTETLARPTPA